MGERVKLTENRLGQGPEKYRDLNPDNKKDDLDAQLIERLLATCSRKGKGIARKWGGNFTSLAEKVRTVIIIKALD